MFAGIGSESRGRELQILERAMGAIDYFTEALFYLDELELMPSPVPLNQSSWQKGQ
ncbi:MAG: hypothetical protein ACRD41_00770 [Candidatus Acidiferrales bacterium]